MLHTGSRHIGSPHRAGRKNANHGAAATSISQEERPTMPRQHTITLIPGDGIGPEVTNAVVRIIEGAAAATGTSFQWESYAVGAEAFERYKEYIPRELYQSIERNRVALKGPVTTPIGGGFASINVTLRKQFELYANFRPIRNLPGTQTRYPGVDLVIVRENTEDLYVGLEHEVVPGVVESLKIVTEKASTRIAKFAFEYARKHDRKKIHAIHKANIMKMSDGLFLRCVREVAKNFPEITYGEHIVDNTCMQLVMNPYQYDMLVLPNLYGDIVSDLCAAFVGGLGLVPSANLGETCAIFEAVHGSAPDIAGQDKANPTALLQSAILMLHHIEEVEAANRIQAAMDKVYAEKTTLTRDVGGTAGTQAFANAVLAAL
jgi:isocitrate dehydrogenase (NAD+)